MIEEIADDLRARVDSDKSDKGKYMDCLKAAGEDNCAKLVAAYLQSTGVDARYVNPGEAGLLLNDEYGNAQVLPKAYDNLKSLSDYSGITIFPGFFGHSLKGDVVTLPRGGSDISGSIVAAAVNADLYETFTDVDNIYSVNPNLINSPKPISRADIQRDARAFLCRLQCLPRRSPCACLQQRHPRVCKEYQQSFCPGNHYCT